MHGRRPAALRLADGEIRALVRGYLSTMEAFDATYVGVLTREHLREALFGA